MIRLTRKTLSYVKLKAWRRHGLDIKPPALSVRCLIKNFSGNNFRLLFTAASVIFHNSIYFSSEFWWSRTVLVEAMPSLPNESTDTIQWSPLNIASCLEYGLPSEGATDCCNVNTMRDTVQKEASTEAFSILRKWLHPPGEDAKFWWLNAGSPLAILVHQAGYNSKSQYASLLFLYCCIVPFLGPRPTPRGRPAKWRSFMTDDFSPIEYSWSWDTPKASPRVRFSVEAIGEDAGTAFDPFNQKMTDELIHQVGSTVTKVDWHLFNYFRSMFYQADTTRLTEADSIAPGLSHNSSLFMAFEPQTADVAVKAYFVPVKAEQTGRSRLSVLTESIQGLERPDLKLPAYDHLLDFLTRRSAACQVDIIGIAIDCIPLSQSRLKIYVRSSKTSFDSVCDFLSLGGNLDTFPGSTLQDFKSYIYVDTRCGRPGKEMLWLNEREEFE